MNSNWLHFVAVAVLFWQCAHGLVLLRARRVEAGLTAHLRLTVLSQMRVIFRPRHFANQPIRFSQEIDGLAHWKMLGERYAGCDSLSHALMVIQ